MKLRRDLIDLLRYGLLLALLIGGWFAVASGSDSVLVRWIVGWLGFGLVAGYYAWLLRRKIEKPRP